MSRVDYGFNQWPVEGFVIEKLYVYLFMVRHTHVLHEKIFSALMI